MTTKEWLEILDKRVKSLAKSERESVISYYSEIVADGLESGASEEEIINNLGNPHDVAKKILDENGVKYTPSENASEKENSSKSSPSQNDFSQSNFSQSAISEKRMPTWLLLILGFFGVLVLFPIFIAGITTLLCLFVTFWECFGAFTFSTGACAIGVFVSLIMGITGTVQSGWALVGACILAVGVMALLTVGFWYISIYTTKLIAFIFKKLKGGKHA